MTDLLFMFIMVNNIVGKLNGGNASRLVPMPVQLTVGTHVAQ